MSAEKLYTPDLLAAAMSLASYPPLPDAALHGEARASTCGSTVAMDLERATDGAIEALGMKVSACAVGQAAAAVFAQHAVGKSFTQIQTSRERILTWLSGESDAVDWPNIALLDRARSYPARHGAIMLPWNAAIAALSTAPASS